ncbi:SET domain-containing protein [Trichostrongylus colubriformis]|uniref:SET domain-containing protein n=1 Tax=Trichostrongylus colubriformis TaxID=6319 RepID=A0AAN8IYE4_TRICO
MSNACEGSPAEDPSAISLDRPCAEPVPAELGPEGEASSEVERESSDLLHPQGNEEEQSVTENSGVNSEAAVNTQTTPVKRFVIADSDDDVTDEEDGAQRSWGNEERILTGDHDYAILWEPKLSNKVESSEAFPVLPGLAELGIVSDDLDVPSDQHITSSRIPQTHLGYEQREPNIINRSPAGVRDGGVYRATEGQSGYLARPARTAATQPASVYRGVQDRDLPHTQQHQQQPHFIVAGYNGTPVARRAMATVPISSSSMIQKRAAPRITSTPTQIRLPGQRMSGTAPHVSIQHPSQRQSPAVMAAPPVQRQVDPPPHRSFHQGPDTSHRVVLVQSSAGSRVAFSPADPSQAALANAPAPLLVSSRGTRQIVRGRGGSVTGRAKKESAGGVSGEETSPAHSPQATARIPMNAPVHGTRATPVSPRKQVHFSDGVAVGPTTGGAPSPLRMQGMPPTSLHHPDLDVAAHQAGVRSPSRLTSARVRVPSASMAPQATATAAAANVTSPPRTVPTTSPETPSLPENFVDDATEAGSQSYTESEVNKNSTLPPEVIAAATSLSAEADVNHPQWTNNDISAEDIKAKIDAISREIAQEMEQKKMESEAQARARKRPTNDVSTAMRRRSATDTQFSGGEEMETGGSNTTAPRGRGRPKGSGRTRSSLSSSSSTSMAATSTTPLHHDVSEGPYGSTRAADYQSSRVSGRSSVRGNAVPITAYDGSMAPELPPPIPPLSNAQTVRGAYQSPGLAQSPHASQRTPMDRSPMSPGFQQKGVNGVSPEEDLANVSSDPSSDEEEAAEEAEWGDYVTRCLCEMQHNDEWMVECEQCNVWQHMKCMGIDPKKFNQNDTYLCEYCNPRPLKWTKKQAQELQLKQLKAVSREKERKLAEKLRRREERKRAKLNQRLKERNHTKSAKRGPAAFKKFQLITRNEYTKRAKQMLALFDTTAGAQSILENSRDLKRGKRMFVAPDIEGLVSTEAIKQDDVIMEYVGHVCLPDECPGRLQRGALQPYCVLYNGLGQNLLCIDARRQGSEARFARRCCRSNSTLKHVLLNGSIYVMLVASERIEKGTEVTIPFDCDFRDTVVPVECACGDDPNCYMKQFNNSLRVKAALEERPNHDVAPQQPQASNGTASGRRAVPMPQKTKTENRGRPKGSGKKEKVSDEPPKKKGPVGRKPKKVGIRLRRHSDSKNTKSSDESMEQCAGADTTETTDEKEVEEKKEPTDKDEVQAQEPPPSTAAPSSEETTTEEVKVEEKTNEAQKVDQVDKQPSSPKKQTSEGNKSAPTSPKKEEQQSTGGRRRSSTGSSRFPKREAIEQLKEVMDYTLPEDRNKPSREERKLQAALAAIERKEEKEKRRAEAHKDSNDAKEKRGPGRPARSSTGSTVSSGRGGRRHSEKHNDKEKKVEAVVEPSVRESPRGKKKREDFKENEVDEVSTIAQPPRKRWAAAVKENEAAQRASSPEVTSSSSATSVGAGDVSSADSVNPSSVGGKKLWLRRHAAESISDESLQATESAASSEPLTCAADSTSDITTLPSRVQMSPPLKKRRHMLDACQSDEQVAATALAQMGAKAEGFRFHWNMALRFLMPILNERTHVDFDLAESVHKPLPQPSVRQPVTTLPSVSVDTATATSTSSQAPMASPVEVRKAKRLSLEDYKRRRSTMGSSENTSASSGATATPTTGSLADMRNRTAEINSRPTRSFIPTMDTSLDQSALLRPLDTSIPIPPLGVPPDLEVVKKMILEESCIPTPPVPPVIPPVETPTNTLPASSSDMSIGSSSESGEERMSLADRLAKEFGVGTAGTQRSPRSVISPSHRAMSLRDVPPPPPPGPRPTRNTRW